MIIRDLYHFIASTINDDRPPDWQPITLESYESYWHSETMGFEIPKELLDSEVKPDIIVEDKKIKFREFL